MNGAIFYSGQYGSTAQYANWISDATGVPAFDVNHSNTDPTDFDFLVLGSSVIVYKLTIRKWVKANLTQIIDKPIILFTVSGESSGPKLSSWIDTSLPETLVSRIEHVALGGRLQLEKLSWWIRLLLKIGAWKSDDPDERKQELGGFDYVDKSGIESIIAWIRQQQSKQGKASKAVERKPLSVV